MMAPSGNSSHNVLWFQIEQTIEQTLEDPNVLDRARAEEVILRLQGGGEKLLAPRVGGAIEGTREEGEDLLSLLGGGRVVEDRVVLDPCLRFGPRQGLRGRAVRRAQLGERG